MRHILNDKKAIVTVIGAIAFVIVDRLFKAMAIQGVFDKPFILIRQFVALDFEANYNIAFSLPFSGIGLNFLIIAIIFALIFYLFEADVKENDSLKVLLLFIVILGAMSNLIDRLLYGYVIDYIYLKYFTIFNFADVMIVSGAVGLILSITRKKADH